MIQVSLTEKPLGAVETDDTRSASGAEIIFQGRVRDVENKQQIIALEYEYYPGMTEKKLHEIAQETIEKYGLQDLFCIHRTGRIKVGEMSIRVIIWSAHRAEGLQGLEWFISRLKTEVPIWKWGIRANGERFPSQTQNK